MLHRMDPRGRCWREMCFKEEEEEEEEEEILPKTRRWNSIFFRWQISLSLSFINISSNPQARENLVVIVSPTRLLIPGIPPVR